MAQGSGNSSITLNEIRKAMFQSPVPENTMKTFATDVAQVVMNRIQMEFDIEYNKAMWHKETHEQRLKELRQLAKSLQEDDWRYPPVDSLIGLK